MADDLVKRVRTLANVGFGYDLTKADKAALLAMAARVEAQAAEIDRLTRERDEARANHFITRVERDGAEDHASETADELRAVRARAEAAETKLAKARAALVRERQRWWSPEYPGQVKPTLQVWFTDEPENGLSGFDIADERDEFHNGGQGPYLRRVTGNEYPQMPFRAILQEIDK